MDFKTVLKNKKNGDRTFAILLMLPALTIITIFIFIPIAKSVFLSFTDYKLANIASGVGHLWNNFSNYKAIFTEGDLWPAIRVTFTFMSMVVMLQLFLGLILSVVLNGSIKGKRFLRSIIMLPWVIPTVITALLWMWLFQPQYGVVNYLLLEANIISQPIAMLARPALALPSVAIAALWKQIPLMTLMLLAGLQTIPSEMYEAATIDGCNGIQLFFHITIPFLRNVIRTTVLMSIIENFKQFPLFWTMTGGGPMNSTTTLAILSYRNAFVNMNFGKGAAVATVWLCLLLVVAFVYNKVFTVNEME